MSRLTLSIGRAILAAVAIVIGLGALTTTAVVAASPVPVAATASPVPVAATVTTVTIDPATTSAGPSSGAFGALPRPNSGVAPTASGDRGGWAQLTLLAVLTLGLAVIGIVIARSTMRNTRANDQR